MSKDILKVIVNLRVIILTFDDDHKEIISNSSDEELELIRQEKKSLVEKFDYLMDEKIFGRKKNRKRVRNGKSFYYSGFIPNLHRKSEKRVNDFFDFVNKLYEYEISDVFIFLHVHAARDIYIRLLEYFERTGDVKRQVVCNYWLIRISYSLLDPEEGSVYYKKARAIFDNSKVFLKLDKESKRYIIRTINNNSLIIDMNALGDKSRYLEMFHHCRFVLDYIKENLEVLEMTEKQFNISSFNANHNIAYAAIELIKDSGLDRCDFSSQIKEYANMAKEHAEKAKAFEILINEGRATKSVADIALIQARYFTGDLKTEEEYYLEIDRLILDLEAGVKTFNENSEEIKISAMEIRFLDYVKNFRNDPEGKLKLINGIMTDMSMVFSESRMSFDELTFRKHMKSYIGLAAEILKVDSIIESVLNGVIRILDRWLYLHLVRGAMRIDVFSEKMISVNPGFFVGRFGFDAIEEVIAGEKLLRRKLRRGFLLHDIGKIGIVTSIISDPNTLGSYEFRAIGRHTTSGEEMLRASSVTLEYAEIARDHHFPGIGDPLVNIFTVIDSKDSSMDDWGRIYKKKKTHNEFLEELFDGSGVKYHPEIVDIFRYDDVNRSMEEIDTVITNDLIRRIFRGESLKLFDD